MSTCLLAINKSIIILFLICIHTAYAYYDSITKVLEVVEMGSQSIKEMTYCKFQECCNEHSITRNTKELEKMLDEQLFGQHIAKKIIVSTLKAHFLGRDKRKPLLLSLQGPTGTGKSFVADLIIKSIYTAGSQSKFVHYYRGRADFPLKSKVDEYNERIVNEVRENARKCPQSLFIFDEVHKMADGIFESLTSIVDYNSATSGYDNTKAIFIFLSNSAGFQISDRLAKLLKAGTLREDTKLSDFEQILEKGAYNLDGGLKKSALIESHVIDHYIPFLPFEKEHITQCLRAEFDKWTINPKNEYIESLTKNINYDPAHGLFGMSGCKGVEKNVAAYLF